MSKLGNRSKISSMTGTHQYNTDFDRLISDAEHGRLRSKGRDDFDRPAYYGTSQCRIPDQSLYDGRRLHAESTKRGD